MTPTILRQLWRVVEQNQANIMLESDDASLVHWLVQLLQNKNIVDRQQSDRVKDYLSTRINLIRDLADYQK